MRPAICLLTLLGVSSAAFAHQPVMDMAPRWSGGYGFQTRYERAVRDRLESDGNDVGNPLGLRSESRINWFEGVYTFHRSVRATVKLPYEQRRKRFLKDGQIKEVEAAGLGDVIVTFPIKRYRNYMTHTTNLAFNPSIILPTATGEGLPSGGGTVGYGLSVSLAREAAGTFGLWDLWSTLRTTGSDGKANGDLVGFDMNFGFYPYANSHKEIATLLLWGTHVRHQFKDRLSSGAPDENSGGRWVEMAPIFVVLYRNVAFRIEPYFPVSRRLNGTQLVDDYRFQAGIGLTFPSLTPF